MTGLDGKKFFHEIKEGLPIPGGFREAPEGIDELAGWAVDNEIWPIVARYKDIVINDDAMRNFLGGYDRLLNFWKLGATAMNPGFHGRNTLSGVWQGYLHHGSGYMNPYLHTTAKRVLQGADGVLTTANRTYTYKELNTMLTDTGSLWKGQLGVDIPKEFGKAVDDLVTPTKTLAQKAKFGVKHPARGARAVGTAVENEQRAADFILSLSKGIDPLEASRQTKHFFFDYNALTPFERNIMRRTFPFYTWMRKNIPLELEQMVAQPNKFIGIHKFKTAAGVMAGETEKERQTQSQWFKELYPIKVPEPLASGLHLALGIDKTKVMYWNPNLPPQDLNRLNLSELVTSLTPPAKVAMELYFNKNIFFDEEIEQYKGQRHKVPGYINTLRAFIPDDSPIFKSLKMEFRKRNGKNVMVMPAKQRYLLDQISPFMKNVGNAMETLPPGKEKSRLTAWLLGVKFVGLDVKQETMERTLERQEELKDLIQLSKSRGQIPRGAVRKKGPLGQPRYEVPDQGIGGGVLGR
jgi:hypothetical protein